MSFLSCIIPTFNREFYLGGAIDSVLAQTRVPDELIIVDDGSTDATRKLVSGIRENTNVTVRYFYQDNQGPAAARNLGIKQAKGEYLIFLDSDDRFTKKKIATQFQALTSQPEYLISHTNEKWLRNGLHLNKKKRHQPQHGDIFFHCLELCAVGMSTVMVHRKIFEIYGMFDESLPCCEDYDFWLRVAAHEPFLLVDEPFTIKQGGRADQVSSIYRVGMDVFRIRSLEKFIDNRKILQNAVQFKELVKECIKKCEIYGKGCLKHDKVEEGKMYLKKAEVLQGYLSREEL